ncbi:MAG: RusA family crossover junction endodeoxyribonuclease [Betaproteobacteria bacterium]|nr:RusA family crossover junction endodeoxyribonuclease [Betaproteobacteria bacterium]
MNGIVYRDDKQVVTLAVMKIYAEMPRVEVEVLTDDWEEVLDND